MKLQKCGIAAFSEKTKNRPVICFGASPLVTEMCSFYYHLKLWKNIIAIADNDVRKQGTAFRVLWNLIDIVSVDTLIDMYTKDPAIVLLITVHHYYCIDIINQLNTLPELDDMECFLYPLFPFCETFSEIPEEVSLIKSAAQQIPKIIHYVWVGENPIPENNLKLMESWKKYCPDYEIKLWNETNYDMEKNQYIAGAYAAKKYGYVPDYMRLDIVYQYGGIYLDVDVQLLKNFDDLLYYPAYFGLGLHSEVNTGHGFGAAPGNNLIKQMRDVYDDVLFMRNDGCYNLTGCGYHQTEVLRWHGFTGGNRFHVIQQDAVVFPTEFFSPMNSAFGTMQVTDNCYSIHHFDNSHIGANELLGQKENRSFMESKLGASRHDT